MKCHFFKLLCLRKLQLKYVTAENDLIPYRPPQLGPVNRLLREVTHQHPLMGRSREIFELGAAAQAH